MKNRATPEKVAVLHCLLPMEFHNHGEKCDLDFQGQVHIANGFNHNIFQTVECRKLIWAFTPTFSTMEIKCHFDLQGQ